MHRFVRNRIDDPPAGGEYDPTSIAAAELRHVVLDYRSQRGSVRGLDDVCLTVAPGSSIAVVGRSGSGKSSLIAVLGLMRSPTAGEVWVNGVPVRGPRQATTLRATAISMVFQSFHLEPHLTVTENTMLRWFLVRTGESGSAAKRRAKHAIECVGLGPLASRRTAFLSGGERQRVAIARALFARPQILIADEPTGNLDEENAAAICDILYSTPRESGCAVVVVTHDQVVAHGADRLIRLERGQIVDDESRTPAARDPELICTEVAGVTRLGSR